MRFLFPFKVEKNNLVIKLCLCSPSLSIGLFAHLTVVFEHMFQTCNMNSRHRQCCRELHFPKIINTVLQTKKGVNWPEIKANWLPVSLFLSWSNIEGVSAYPIHSMPPTAEQWLAVWLGGAAAWLICGAWPTSGQGYWNQSSWPVFACVLQTGSTDRHLYLFHSISNPNPFPPWSLTQRNPPSNPTPPPCSTQSQGSFSKFLSGLLFKCFLHSFVHGSLFTKLLFVFLTCKIFILGLVLLFLVFYFWKKKCLFFLFLQLKAMFNSLN